MLIRVGISCCISYSIVSYLFYALVDQITSVGEGRASFLLLFTYNFVVSLPLGTLYGLRYFVLALTGPSYESMTQLLSYECFLCS